MRRKTLSERELRVLASMKLLSHFGQQQLPAECTSRDDIERLLGLNAANLVKASFDAPVRERSGDVYIPRAVVLEVTAEGHSALARARRQQPEHFDDMPARRPRSRRVSKVADGAAEEASRVVQEPCAIAVLPREVSDS
ncbi:hypothetical protein [Variovorax paradoxus]|uniref:hypothetical protein n=1 Tax=Variovorax paradoxus TaxID=34073 RepID=UPI00193371DC|nr:hypothetical protein INQ48_34225 [Variovorax paradoxus]